MNKSFAASSDQEIWQQFIEGDREALSYIYQHHFKPLFRYGNKLLFNADLVEDCIQDLFLELWNCRDRLGTTTSIRFYLLTSLRRKIFKQLSQHGTPEDIPPSDYIFSVEYSVEDVLIGETNGQELQLRLNKALEKLTARQKEAIYLKFYNDLDYQEIAVVMNINYQSIRTLVYQAVKVLREQIAPALALGAIFGDRMLP